MDLDPKILDILACPSCKGKLHYDKDAQELVCKFDKVVYPIRDGIPVLLIEEARPIASTDGN